MGIKLGSTRVVEILLGVIGVLLMAIGASMATDMGRIASSVQELNVKVAVVVEQTAGLDKRVQKLEQAKN